MTDEDPTQPDPLVPPPWPTACPTPPKEYPTQETPTQGAPGPYDAVAGGWTPPGPKPGVSVSGKGVALIAAVALFFGGAGAAVGVAISNSSSNSTSPSSFVAPRGNGSSNGSEGGGVFPGFGGSDSGGSSSTPKVNIDVHGIASRVNPAIVNIETSLSGGSAAAGTGMVISSTGLVVTNNHVINGATKVQVEVGITGKKYTAKVLGYDVADDVALIKLNNASGMKTITTANASSVSRNDEVVAIGNALGRFGTPSAVGGRVTALHQKVTAGDGTDSETLSDMIRIAASIQPGDSGGALVNDSGQVIGMNTAADTGGGRFGFQTGGTTGFAIPIGNAMAVVDQIKSGDSSNGVHIGDRALLGVVLQDASGSPFGSDNGNNNSDQNGAAVADTGTDTPAQAAGLQGGDTITGLGKHTIDTSDDLRAALETYRPGDKVTVTWVDQSGQTHHASVTLTKGPPA